MELEVGDTLGIAKSAYEAAFDDFYTCAENAGMIVSKVEDPDTGLLELEYHSPLDDRGRPPQEADECWRKHFQVADELYRSENREQIVLVSTDREFAHLVEPCLIQAGIPYSRVRREVPYYEDPGLEEALSQLVQYGDKNCAE